MIYIEPYPKSRALEFHDDSVTVRDDVPGKVRFKPFIGVGPRQFFELFSLSLSSGRKVRRKTADGLIAVWEETGALPRVSMLPFSHPVFESASEKYLLDLEQGEGQKDQANG